ncbi:MAG: LamG-like jellyroll fold domain-containing protein [Bacteroidota bacterium]
MKKLIHSIVCLILLLSGVTAFAQTSFPTTGIANIEIDATTRYLVDLSEVAGTHALSNLDAQVGVGVTSVNYYTLGELNIDAQNSITDGSAITSINFGGYNTTQVAGLTAEFRESYGYVSLSWTAFSNATGYLIFREWSDRETFSTDPLKPIAVIQSGSTTTYNDYDVSLFNDNSIFVNGTEPTYFVMAYGVDAGSPGSEFITKAVQTNLVDNTALDYSFLANTSADNEAQTSLSWSFPGELLKVYPQLHLTIEGNEFVQPFTQEYDASNERNALPVDISKSIKRGSGYLRMSTPYTNYPDWTIELWMSTKSKNFQWLSAWDNNSEKLVLNNGYLSYGGNSYLLDSTEMSHIAISQKGNGFVEVYQDGKLLGRDNNGITNTKIPIQYIGTDVSWGTANLEEELAMVRVWSEARTAKQIQSDMSKKYLSDADNLLDEWIFESQEGNTAISSNTSSGITLNINGSYNWQDIYMLPATISDSYLHWVTPYTSSAAYTLTFRDRVTGKQIITRSATADLSSANSNQVSLMISQGTNHNKLSILPSSSLPTSYKITRTDGTNSKDMGHVTPNVFTGKFNGVNSVIPGFPGFQMNHSGIDYRNQWSAAILFKHESASGKQRILGTAAAREGWFQNNLFIENDILYFQSNRKKANKIQVWAVGPVTPGQWNHVMLVGDGIGGTTVKTRCYVNGILMSEENGSQTTFSFTNPTLDFIGSAGPEKGEYFKGELAYIAVKSNHKAGISEIASYQENMPLISDGWRILHFDENGIKFSYLSSGAVVTEDISGTNVSLNKGAPLLSTNGVLNSKMPLTFIDSFQDNDAGSIKGGVSYQYAIQPYYSNAGKEYLEETNIETKTQATYDFQFEALYNSVNQEIQLGWVAHSNFRSLGIDSLRIYRDASLIGKVKIDYNASTASKQVFADNQYTPGTNHIYSIKPVLNGKNYFAQESSVIPNANGFISGYFVDQNGFIVPSRSSEKLSGVVDGVNVTVDYSSGAVGTFTSASAIFYGKSTEFSWPSGQKTILSVDQPIVSSLDVLVNHTYQVNQLTGTTSLITSFDAVSDAAKSQVNLTIDLANLVIGERYFYTIYRGNEVLRRDTLTAVASTGSINGTTVDDLKGVQGTNYDYKVIVYQITNGNLDVTYSEATKSNVKFPEYSTPIISVADLMEGSGAAGYSLDVTFPAAENFYAIQLYRGNDLIKEELKTNFTGILSCQDTLGVPGKSYVYEARIINNQKQTGSTATHPALSYPSYSSYVVSGIAATYDKTDRTLSISVPSAQIRKDWDGMVYYNEDTDEVLGVIDESNSNSSQIIQVPAYPTHALKIGYYPYKQTHEGIFTGTRTTSSSIINPLATQIVEGKMYSPLYPVMSNFTAVPGVAKIDWSSSGIQSDSVLISYLKDGMTITKMVPSTLGQWYAEYDNHFAGTENVSFSDEASISVNSNVNLTADSNSGVQNLLNFQASDGADGYILVSWEYPEDYADADFELVRYDEAGTPLNLGVFKKGIHSYLDEQVTTGNTYLYSIRAKVGDQYSQYGTDPGYSNDYQVVNGYLVDQNGLGIPGAWLTNQDQFIKTDSTGYFSLDNLSVPSGTSTISLTAYSPKLASSSNHIVTLNGAETSVYLEETGVIIQTLRDPYAEVAAIVGFSATPDPLSGDIKLRWSLSGENYDGVELSQFGLMADVAKVNGNTYTDNSRVPGQKYAYFIKPYLKVNGKKVYGYSLRTDATYPTIDAPTVFSASAIVQEGVVKLQWFHPDERVDGYQVYRQNELIGDVLATAKNELIDSTGISGRKMIYKLLAYRAKGDLFESNHLDATINYPYAESISNFTATTANPTDNVITLSWNVDQNTHADQIEIYRGDDEEVKLATLDIKTLGFIDSTAVPNTNVSYAIRTVKKVGNVLYPSPSVNTVVYLPSLADPTTPSSLPVTLDNQLKLGWQYSGRNIDYFELVIDAPDLQAGTTSALNFDQSVVISFKPGKTSYDTTLLYGLANSTYQVKVRAVAEREGDKYYSDWSNSSITYPVLSQPQNIAVKYAPKGPGYNVITWDYDYDLIDGFEVDVHVDGTSVEKKVVDASTRSYTYYPDLGTYNSDINDLDFYVRVLQDLSGQHSAIGSVLNTGVTVSKKSSFVVSDFDASDDKAPVELTWSGFAAPTSDKQRFYELIKWHIYRDEILLTTINNKESISYSDLEATQGIESSYTIVANIEKMLIDLKVQIESYRDYLLNNIAVLPTATAYNSNGSVKYEVYIMDNESFWDEWKKEWDDLNNGAVIEVNEYVQNFISDFGYKKISILALDPFFNPYLQDYKTCHVGCSSDNFKWGYWKAYLDNGVLVSADEIIADIDHNLGLKNSHAKKIYPFANAYSSGRMNGTGEISGIVLGASSDPVKDVPLAVRGEIKRGNEVNYVYLDTVYTDGNGRFSFLNVPHGKNDIEYTITPIGSGAYYPNSESIFLNDGTTAYEGLTFVDTNSFIVTGNVRYTSCQNCIVDDSLKVTMQVYDVSNTEIERRDTYLDNGIFSFDVQPNESIGKIVTLIEEPISFHPDVAQQMVNRSWKYDFERDAGSGLLQKSINYADLKSTGKVSMDLIDQTAIPVKFAVGTVCGPINYAFKIKLESEHLDTILVTNNIGYIDASLPPYKFKVRVVGTTKNDVYSATVVDYFRSRELELDLEKAYIDYSTKYETDNTLTIAKHFEKPVELIFHRTPQIAISGMQSVQSCSNIAVPVVNQSTVEQPGTASVHIDITEQFDGRDCPVTDGYVVITNPGAGETVTLQYDAAQLEFPDYVFEPKVVNLIAPYTHLLEVAYYTNDGDFKAYGSQEYIVLGEYLLPGSDVFVDSEFGDTNIPLFVLRDPPGDNSYSWIEEGSELAFTMSNNFIFERDWKHTTGGTLVSPGDKKLELKGGYTINDTQGDNSSGQFKLVFNERISTAPVSKTSTNLKGYLDGRKADIVVGAGATRRYGITGVLEIVADPANPNACQLSLSNNIGVDAGEINTIWYYTVSQIESTIRYYDQLLKGASADQGTVNIIDEPGDDTDPANTEAWLRVAKSNWENVLNFIDKDIVPPCEMCKYYAVNSDDFNSSALSGFCNDKVGTDCGSLDIANWEQGDYTAYDQAYKDFVEQIYFDSFSELWSTLKNTTTDLRLRGDESISDAANGGEDSDAAIREWIKGLWSNGSDVLYDPIENVTFSGGTKLSRSFSTNSLLIDTETDNYTDGFHISAGFGFKGEIEAGSSFLSKTISSFDLFLLSEEVEVKWGKEFSVSEESYSSLSVGYELGDDDDGDHFNVTVFHDPYNRRSTTISPYFYLRGGRSSAPYEEWDNPFDDVFNAKDGTISRDEPTLAFQDEQGNNYPTVWNNLDPNSPVQIPLMVNSGNPFYEDRLISIGLPPGYNQNAAGLAIENVSVVGRQADVWTKGDNGGTAYTNLIVTPKNGIYDYPDLAIVARPHDVKGELFSDGPHVFDTLQFSVHFRKPVSPVAISGHEGSWSIDAGTDNFTFHLNGYDVDSMRFSLKEITMEYKRSDQESDEWTTMSDGNQLTYDYLRQYFYDFIATYPTPVYPFVWNIKDLNLPDGQYLIRARATGKNGGFNYSNVYSGTIDQTRPEVEQISYVELDTTFYNSTLIRVQFTETMLANLFNPSMISLYDQTAGSDAAGLIHEIYANGNTLNIYLDKDMARLKNGNNLLLTINKSYADANGNEMAADVSHSFKLISTKVSGVSVSLTDDDYISTVNSSLGLKLKDYQLDGNLYALDSISIAYRSDNTTANWNIAKIVSRAELLTGSEQNAAGIQFLTDWSGKGAGGANLADGPYQLRADVYHAGSIVYSSDALSVIIDTTAPVFTESFAPKDSILGLGIPMSFKFNEALEVQSLASLTITPKTPGDTVTTPVALNISGGYYDVIINSSDIVTYFRDQFYAEYAGDSLWVSLSNFTDVYGNAFAGTLRVAMYVPTSAAVATSLVGSDLSGRHIPETGAIELNWNETSSDYTMYEVERSPDGKEFTVINTQQAGDADEYLLMDYTSITDVLYYRVNQLDANGNHLYTKTIAVMENGMQDDINIIPYPNPIKRGDYLSISLQLTDLDDDVQIELMNTQGQLKFSKQIRPEDLSDNLYKILITNELNSGLYFIRVRQGAFTSTSKLMIE